MHHGYAQAEGVANLDKVPATGCLVDIGYPKFGGGVGGYARFVAICPPGSRARRAHRAGARGAAAQVRLAAALGRARAACACASADYCRTLGAMRVRFAPSPTGQLHIGGARTALYNWLVARGQGGTMVLRIEDTDRERSTPENVEQILDALRWLEIDYDEGPISQVARSDRHQEVLQRLLDSGHAYRSNATADDVKAFKAQHGADRGFRGEGAGRGRRAPARARRGRDRRPRPHPRRHHLPARAHGRPGDRQGRRERPLQLRGRRRRPRRGDHARHPRRGPPLQHAQAAARARGAGAEPPVYAHLPLLHGPDGKKLSKRHGAASVQELREAGYLPEAVRNYIALLGWGDADDETLIPTDELVKRFRIERVSRNPAQFDEQKLRWMNGRYMRELGTDEITRRLEELTGRSGLHDAVAISEEKIQTLADFWPLAGFIFDGPADDPAAREKWLADGGRDALADARTALEGIEPFDSEHIEQALRGVVDDARRQGQGRLPAGARRAGRNHGLTGHLRDPRGPRTRRGAGAHRRRSADLRSCRTQVDRARAQTPVHTCR